MEQRVDFAALRYLLRCREHGFYNCVAVTTPTKRPAFRRRSTYSSYFIPNVYRWGNAIACAGPQLGFYELGKREIGEPHPFQNLESICLSTSTHTESKP